MRHHGAATIGDRMRISVTFAAAAALLLAGCGDSSKLPEHASVGPNPTIPPPEKSYIPTVNIARAKGWPRDGKPTAAATLAVNAFAKDLDHPRWLYVLPNGDVLVAESTGPRRPGDNRGVKGWLTGVVENWATGGTPSADRITLLRDKDGDGKAETRTVFIKDLYSPFGMTLIGND